MSIAHTRSLLRAALDGSLERANYQRDPAFGLLIPKAVPGVPPEVLDPREAWADKDAYDQTAREVVGRFEKNFETFLGAVDDEVRAAAMRAAA